ncbi:hypothetical protein ACIQM0_01455 [Streptomyces sp. NPDC091387]|uniref:hypothetical protein n=1 Tax=Streptomyces sp. NPDC091387 TaxID=3365998 RepID=UPI00382D5054
MVLTTTSLPPSDEVSRAVRAVLAGELIDNAAGRIGMHPTALIDAVHVFTQAGTEALRRQDRRTEWAQFYVELPTGPRPSRSLPPISSRS